MSLKIYSIVNQHINKVYFILKKNYKIYMNIKWFLFKNGNRNKWILKSLRVLKKILELLYRDSMSLFLKRF